MDYLLTLATDPAAWVALAALTTMELVLGIDNLLFISILSNKLPQHLRSKARRIGIAGALIQRLLLLSLLAVIVQLTDPVFEVFDQAFSWRDLILIAGGLFLVWKATKEIHSTVDPEPIPGVLGRDVAAVGIQAAVFQILLLDLVFSVDSIITAVGMTPHLPIMVLAVLISIVGMLLAADPLAKFIHANPTIVMLALGFLLLIGTALIAEGFGASIPKGYIYAAMAFAALIEGLNMMSRRAQRKKLAAKNPPPPTS